MTESETFGEELHGLVERHSHAGMPPQDLIDEMSKQIALIIDQNNLELEMLIQAREGKGSA